MDRVAAILRFQWRAYWRRFQRKGNLTTNNAGVWVLFGGICVFKYLQQLPGVAAQLSRNEPSRYEALSWAVFVVWILPVMGESWRSISSRGLLHTPLTSTQLFFIRVGSVFVSPVSWIITACSLALVYPIARAAHPVTGFAALLLFVLFSLAMSLTIAHVLSHSNLRRILTIAFTVLWIALGASWFATGKVFSSNSGWSPTRLVAGAAVGSKPLASLAVLAAMMIAAFGLAFWSFTGSLQSAGNRRSQRFTVLGLIEFPGRLGGLLKKDLRYFVRLLDLYFALPVVILFIYYIISAPEPSASIFRVVLVLLFLPWISLASNFFGIESPLGLDRYALFPLSGREILLSKNLAFALLFVSLAAAIFPFAIWKFGAGVALLGAVEVFLVVLAYLSWGNWMSVRDPYKMQFYRFSAGGSPADAIIGMLFGSLPGVIMVYLFSNEDSGATWKIALLMITYAALYYLSVTRSGRRLEARREQVRHLLS